MKRFLFVGLLCVASIAFSGVLGRASFDSFFARSEGEWSGQGKAFGATAQGQYKWEKILDGKFFRLSLSYTTKGSDGVERVFSGHGYYQSKGNGVYEGQWFDSQGNQYPIKATLEGDALTALWGIPGKIEGRSIYRLSDEGKKFVVTDAMKQADGNWREFSNFELSKK